MGYLLLQRHHHYPEKSYIAQKIYSSFDEAKESVFKFAVDVDDKRS